MTLLDSAFSMEVPHTVRHRVVPVALFKYLVIIGIGVLCFMDLFVSLRFHRTISGKAVRDIKTTPKRYPPSPKSADPSRQQFPWYCSDPSFRWPITDPFVQVIMGRFCTVNSTCNAWFDDYAMSEITPDRIRVVTHMAGHPIPWSPPDLSLYDPVAVEDAMGTRQAAIMGKVPESVAMEKWKSVFGNDFDSTCTPGYIVTAAEDLGFMTFHGFFAGEGFGRVNLPRTKVFDTNGDLVVDLPPKSFVLLQIKDLFKLNFSANNAPEKTTNFPESPPVPLRMTGIQGNIDFRYSNAKPGSITTDIYCEVRPTIFQRTVGLMNPREADYRAHLGDMKFSSTIQKGKFVPLGLDISISSSVELHVFDLYALFQHFVGFMVLASSCIAVLAKGTKTYKQYTGQWTEAEEEKGEKGEREGEEEAATAEREDEGSTREGIPSPGTRRLVEVKPVLVD